LIFKGHKPDNIFISMERRMKCGIGHCGHCQIGAKFVCKDGPIFSLPDIKRFPESI
jgi:NAD(P)H-flavin reductase